MKAPMMRFLATVLATGALLLCGWASAEPGRGAKVKLDIKAQSMERALNAFAEQTGFQVLFRASEVPAGLSAPKLEGTYVPEEALRKLLANSSLSYEFINTRTVAIRGKWREKVGVEGPAGQMRVADNAAFSNGSFKSQDSAESEDSQKNQVTVEGQRDRQRAYTDANVDIPRTTNDVQPYYVFDSTAIDQSGAANVEDFLKTQLTMNTVGQTGSQVPPQSSSGSPGNMSAVNLRGLGTDHTLILINGRRAPGVTTAASLTSIVEYQPDLNGIPLSAIERIEVLPSSASGIYGGGAVGGVVNVVLKRNYAGGEIRAAYDNTWNTDAPKRTVSASLGQAFEGGRTRLFFTGAGSDSQPLLFNDRRQLYEEGIARIRAAFPGDFSSASFPPLGLTPNIGSSSGNLVLDDGTPLNVPTTHIPVGTSASTSAELLVAGMLANAGQFDFTPPPTTQAATGLFYPLGSTPKTGSLMASLSREMFTGLELFVEGMYNRNRSEAVNNPINAGARLTIEPTYPSNPFRQRVFMTVPDAGAPLYTTELVSKQVAVGARFSLPHEWSGEADYTFSKGELDYRYPVIGAGLTTDLASGALNPFVDTLLHPLDFSKYYTYVSYRRVNTLGNLAARASGPLPDILKTGNPRLTVALDHRDAVTEPGSLLVPTQNLRTVFFERSQKTASGYAELLVPLVRMDRFPGVHSLELQAAGRIEQFTVQAGTTGYRESLVTSARTYSGPTLVGEPFRAEDKYSSANSTLGVKFEPIPSLTLRASRATAFLPPSPAQLIENPAPGTGTITDPRNGTRYSVQVLSGGNADLKPKRSTSQNFGLIWQPGAYAKGLRLNAEYYRIAQSDAVVPPSTTQLLQDEAFFADRITRDAMSGLVTAIDTRLINLFKLESEGLDLSGEYPIETSGGRLTFRAVRSINLHFKTQYARTLPAYEGVGFPNEGGIVKDKSTASVVWEKALWTAGVTFHHLSSYKQFGAAGGPSSVRSYNGAPTGDYTLVYQGGETIPAQAYVDVFFGYTNRSSSPAQGWRGALFDGWSVQAGVKNLFDKIPPFDANFAPYYVSPYGDWRQRSYWLSARKEL